MFQKRESKLIFNYSIFPFLQIFEGNNDIFIFSYCCKYLLVNAVYIFHKLIAYSEEYGNEENRFKLFPERVISSKSTLLRVTYILYAYYAAPRKNFYYFISCYPKLYLYAMMARSGRLPL